MVDVVSSFTTLSARGAGEDRVSVLELDGAVIAVVADGAGGIGGGAEAAELVVAAVAGLRERVFDLTPDSLARFLEDVDLKIAASPSAGESTAVVAVVAGDRVVGASVGDSEAWMLHGSAVRDLTENQRRKPLLGSGRAVATGFGPERFAGTLLLGSDGLFKYVPRRTIVEHAVESEPSEIATTLAELARLPSGDLHDDIGVVALASTGRRA